MILQKSAVLSSDLHRLNTLCRGLQGANPLSSNHITITSKSFLLCLVFLLLGPFRRQRMPHCRRGLAPNGYCYSDMWVIDPQYCFELNLLSESIDCFETFRLNDSILVVLDTVVLKYSSTRLKKIPG